MNLKKIYALFFSIVMLLTMVLCACGIEQVAVPYSSDYCIGKNQASIQRDFSEVGFTNIQYNIVDDLEISEASKDEQVVSVEIDGASEFNAGAMFNFDASVVITYHTIKNIAVPFSSGDVEDTEVEEIIKSLEDVGFVEFAVEEVFDLDPDDTDEEFENRVFIGGNSSFYSGYEFPMNSEVKIVTHRPYEKYTLKLSIDFVENWIFSTYDVEMEFDGHYEDLAHGKDGNFEYRVKPGKYTLTFSSEEDSDTKGTVELDIKGDTTASYKINCHSGYIDVTTLSVEDKGAVGDNEAMVPYSASDCKYEDYKDIEKVFKNAGFTNISTEILYDIVWGWTDEGEVDKVSINGNTKFIKGDVFSKDIPIVITYHMKEEDDPKHKETKPESNKTETLSSVFYSTNDYETAMNGNSGVFSYKSKDGSYDAYWIIDFDEGYAYFFTDGNGENFCDKVKITSGTLNDQMTITWNVDGEKTNWYLHFKYVNSPVTLIINDHMGITTEFTTTDLDDALKLRDTKNIVES